MERRTTDGSGYSLYFNSGGTYSGSTNRNGGNMYFSSGIATGTGSSNIYFRTTTPGSSGTADISPSTKMTILGNGNVGIGETSPTAPLYILDEDFTKLVLENDGTTPKSYFGNDGGGLFLSQNAYWDGSAWQSNVAASASFVFAEHVNNNQFEFRVRPASGNFSTAMVIETNGDVGIGTTIPAHRLDVETNSSLGYAARFINFGDNSDRYGIRIQAGTNDNSGTNYMIRFFDGDGSYNGAITSSGGTVTYGAKSAKLTDKGIKDFNENALSLINQIKVVNFKNSVDSDKFNTGFIGENLIEVLPESTIYDSENDEYFTDKSSLVPVLTKAIQEQQAQIDDLKKEIQELKTLILKK